MRLVVPNTINSQGVDKSVKKFCINQMKKKLALIYHLQ